MRRQCKKCPWRKDVDPNLIPNGYDVEKHRGLCSTIAEPGRIVPRQGVLRIMACHESPNGREKPCVGWLSNQLGPGNNIPLRLAVALGKIDADFKLVGEQHETLEETLPREDD